jgi:hypothetical protein
LPNRQEKIHCRWLKPTEWWMKNNGLQPKLTARRWLKPETLTIRTCWL